MDEILKISQAAKYLDCHPNTVRNHLSEWGFWRMPGSRIWRVRKSYLDLIKEKSNNIGRLALSVEEITSCRSTKDKTRGGLISQPQTEKELDDLLARM